MNKKFLICIGVIMLIIGSSYKIKANPEPGESYDSLDDSAQNTAVGSDKTYTVCKTCENNAYPDKTYTRLVISGENENGEQTSIELILCNDSQYEVLGEKCDIHVSNETVPNPVHGNMATNLAYHDAINKYFDETVKNGNFEDSVIANAIAKVYCDSDVMTEECNDNLKRVIAERRANGMDDPFDVNGYPGAEIKRSDGTTTMVDAFVADLCAYEYPGVNGFLCENLNGACESGSATNYSGIHTSETVKKGTLGICTYDTENKLNTIKTCSDFCQNNSDLENCNMCCKVKDGTPYYDNSDPACNNVTQKPDDTPSGDDCPMPKTICEINPSSCIGYDDKLPSPNISGGSCDSNYSSDTYEITGSFADSCGYVPIIKHTTVEINYPSSINRKIYAGQGFNWYGSFSGTATITLYAGNTSKLSAVINILNSEKAKANAQMNCDINKAIDDAWDDYYDDIDSCDDEFDEEEQKRKCKNGITEPDETAIEEAIKNQYSLKIKELDDEIKKLNDCLSEASSYQTSTKTDYDAATTHSNVMKLDNGYTQSSNSVKYVSKNNGLPLTKFSENAFENKYNFFVASNIKNGVQGNLIATGSSPYVGSLEATCPMKISNYFMCNGNDCESGGIAVIYRPISLTNPFPDAINGETYRDRLGYWDQNSPNIFIKNNRDTNDYNVYNLTPMYDITLTPTDIKKIRQYNKHNSFSDFNLECENGLYCKSNFLRNSEYSYIINISNSCAMGSDWYACDTEKMGNTRDSLLNILKN